MKRPKTAMVRGVKVISGVVFNALVFIIALAWLIPALGLFVSSFRSRTDIVTSGWWNAFAEPLSLTLDNYVNVIAGSGVGTALVNSMIISIPATLFTLAIAAIGAYPLSFFQFRGKSALFITFVSLQIIPLQVTLIPVLGTLRSLGLAGTFPGIWLAHTAYGLPFAIYLFCNFFGSIPASLIESAQIDGAGNLRIFISLVLPLSVPVIASLGIFQFLWVWNDLLIALSYLGGTPEVAPLTVKIASMLGSLEAGWHVMTAAAFVSMALPLAVFFGLQRYFIKGILAGAIKG